MVVVGNKAEDAAAVSWENTILECYELGMGDPLPISAGTSGVVIAASSSICSMHKNVNPVSVKFHCQSVPQGSLH